MKARKIDLSSYETGRLTPDGEKELMSVATSLANLLFHPGLKLNGLQLLERQPISRQILGAVADVPEGQPVPAGCSILLSDADYAVLKQSVMSFTGYTQEFVEMVQRVADATVVEVDETKQE